MPEPISQLISYIAPAAPATRRPGNGDESFLRPEIGFTPAWFRQHLNIDFGESFHTNPSYRRDAVVAMRELLRNCFPGTGIGQVDLVAEPLDLLTGLFGACSVAAIYDVPIIYATNNWPNCEHQYLSDEQIDQLDPPDLDSNSHFQQIMQQVDWIAESEGPVVGYINWQGILNNAQRLRGQQLFLDMLTAPERAKRLFRCVCQTMIDAATLLHARQRETGFGVAFFTVSNCLVNIVSPQLYEEFLLPWDQRIAEVFGCLGIHNCAWSATPYLEHYAQVPQVAYIDMGLESDLSQARELFPDARRALMYTPMDLMNKPLTEIEQDLERIATEYWPCDLVFADIDAGMSHERVISVIEICKQWDRSEKSS